MSLAEQMTVAEQQDGRKERLAYYTGITSTAMNSLPATPEQRAEMTDIIAGTLADLSPLTETPDESFAMVVHDSAYSNFKARFQINYGGALTFLVKNIS